MVVELVMQVSRGGDDRLSGCVRLAQGAHARDFSGTLELLRVFEELVPIGGSADGRPRALRPDSPTLPNRRSTG